MAIDSLDDGSEADSVAANPDGAAVDGDVGNDAHLHPTDGSGAGLGVDTAIDTVDDVEDATFVPTDIGAAPPKDSDKDGVPDDKDCAPFDKTRHAGATEKCNGKDDDCDGKTDEGTKNACGKCGPLPKESCNGKDDDCDGKTDEGTKNACGKCGLVPPEKCNGKDDDCDGKTDEGTKNACGKCGAVPKESCNGKDDDCDGKTDEGVCVSAGPQVCYPGPTKNYKTCFKLTPKSQIKIAGYSWAAHSSPQYKSPTNLLNLGSAPASTKVAANFTLGEFMQKSKGQYGVFSAKTVSRLQSVRSGLGVALHINSGFRSPGYNATISGAAKFSRHQYGDAADMTTKGKTSLQAIISKCKANGAGYTQLYTSHVHCDWRNDTLGHDFWPQKGKSTGNSQWQGPPPPPPPSAGDQKRPPPGRKFRQIPGSWARIERVAAQGPVRKFVATWGPAFSEGTPWISWVVVTPTGRFEAENTRQLQVSVREKGAYSVALEIGAAETAVVRWRVQ